MKRETKAQRIFKDTYTMCRCHIKTWGFARNADGTAIGFNNLVTRDDETTYKRTWNEIRNLIEAERRQLDRYAKYKVIEVERLELLSFALEMVESTLNNTIKTQG